MRVVLHPADTNGCGYYRMILPGFTLESQGYDVCVETDFSYRGVWRTTIRGEVLVNLDQTVKADVIVIQRPLHRNRVELIRVLQSKGVAVVVEVDDDFHAIHKRNAAWNGTSLLNHADHHRDWLAKACEMTDLVTVSTPALAARYGSHGRVVVLPNRIPRCYLDVPQERDPDATVVGWSGSVATHPGDLEQTGGALAGFNWRIVGTGKGVRKALGLGHQPPFTGWVDLADYPAALATLDVGVIPLALSAFNEAKSALKGLEMGAVGVPWVASPTGPYRQLRAQGAGRLADSPSEWHDEVDRLVRDHEYRVAVRDASREVAAANTVEAHAPDWWEAWSGAVERRQAVA